MKGNMLMERQHPLTVVIPTIGQIRIRAILIIRIPKILQKKSLGTIKWLNGIQ